VEVDWGNLKDPQLQGLRDNYEQVRAGIVRDGMRKTPLAALSRAVVGLKGKTLLINLPGSPEGAEDSLRAILSLLPHAIGVIRGEAVHGSAPEPAPAAEPAAPADVPAASEAETPPEGLGKDEAL